MRSPALFGLVALLAGGCGTRPAPPVDHRLPCGSQTTCDPEYQKVCDSGYCSGALPPIGEHYEKLALPMTPQMQLAPPRSLRAAVLYSTTPEGKVVRCPGATLAANQVAITDMKSLSDPAKFNLTAPLLEVNRDFSQDLIQTFASVNGTGRVVYAELYAQTLVPGEPDSGGKPIGVGCVENAPYNADSKQAAVEVTLEPPP